MDLMCIKKKVLESYKVIPEGVRSYINDHFRQFAVAIGIGACVGIIWYFYPEFYAWTLNSWSKSIASEMSKSQSLIYQLGQERAVLLATQPKGGPTLEFVQTTLTNIHQQLEFENDRLKMLKQAKTTVEFSISELPKYSSNEILQRKAIAVGIACTVAGFIFLVIK